MPEVPPIPSVEPATYPQEMARWGLGALAVGGGARLLKHVLDIARNRDVRTPITGKALRSPVAEVPIDVTPEEAQQLHGQGVMVKQAGILTFAEVREAAERARKADKTLKQSADAIPPQDAGGGLLTGPFARKAALGGLATLGLMGGWKAADLGVDYFRKSEARQRLDATKRRVERLLDADPMPQDAKIAGAMAACEDAVLAKVAAEGGFVNGVADYTINLPGINNLGYLAGPAAILSVLGAYHRAKATSKSEAAIKGLSGDYEASLQPRTPYLQLAPRVRRPEEPKPVEAP